MNLVEETQQVQAQTDKRLEDAAQVLNEKTKVMFGMFIRNAPGPAVKNSVKKQRAPRNKIFVYGTLMNPSVRNQFCQIPDD